MNRKQLLSLLKRYENGTCDEAEKALLEQWFAEQSESRKWHWAREDEQRVTTTLVEGSVTISKNNVSVKLPPGRQAVTFEGKSNPKAFGDTYTRSKGLEELLKHLESLSDIRFELNERRVTVMM